jgi:hypothetical protein
VNFRKCRVGMVRCVMYVGGAVKVQIFTYDAGATERSIFLLGFHVFSPLSVKIFSPLLSGCAAWALFFHQNNV